MNEKTLTRLDEIAQLEENWDSYGALPISKEAQEVATIVAEVFSALAFRAPTITPTASGGISFEYYSPRSDAEFSFSIDSDGRFETVFAYLNKNTSWESYLDNGKMESIRSGSVPQLAEGTGSNPV